MATDEILDRELAYFADRRRIAQDLVEGREHEHAQSEAVRGIVDATHERRVRIADADQQCGGVGASRDGGEVVEAAEDADASDLLIALRRVVIDEADGQRGSRRVGQQALGRLHAQVPGTVEKDALRLLARLHLALG